MSKYVSLLEGLTPIAAFITLRGRCAGGKLGRGPLRRKLRASIDAQLKEMWVYGAAVDAAPPGTTLAVFNAAYPMELMSDTRAEVDRVFVEALRAFPEMKDDSAGGSALFVIRQYASAELKELLEPKNKQSITKPVTPAGDGYAPQTQTAEE